MSAQWTLRNAGTGDRRSCMNVLPYVDTLLSVFENTFALQMCFSSASNARLYPRHVLTATLPPEWRLFAVVRVECQHVCCSSHFLFLLQTPGGPHQEGTFARHILNFYTGGSDSSVEETNVKMSSATDKSSQHRTKQKWEVMDGIDGKHLMQLVYAGID